MWKFGMVVLVAGALAAAVAGSATGGQSPPPTVFWDASSGPSNAAPGPGMTTVAALKVPSGTYAVHAKAVLITSTSTAGDCYLYAGRRIVDISNQQLVNLSATARSTFNTQFVGRVAFGEVLRLRCRTGQRWSATNSKVAATRVNAVP